MLTDLWDHQVRALDALRQSVKQGVRRIVLQAPTGSGKTLCAAAVVDGALQKGKRVAFVVPLISLIDQTMQKFYEQEIRDCGIIQANHVMTDWSKPVQICSIQTLSAREVLPEANVVIFDECHLLFQRHKKWLTDETWSKVPFIGLSATPWTKGLGKYFDSLLTVATTQELIDKGLLSKFKVFATGHPDLSRVKIVAGDYQENQLSDAMRAGSLTADIVETWKTRWGKDKTLCFAVDRAHAQALQARFLEADISCGYQDANTPDIERTEIKRKFHSGDYRVVVNIDTLVAGVDWDVRCLQLCRPTRSRMRFVQIIGRALRTAPDKEFALILDHSDTTERLGFVTDIFQEHLDGGKDKPKAEPRVPLPKECKSCGFLKPPGTGGICPNCGFKAVVTSGISERDGELVEVTAGARAKKGKVQHTMEQKAKFFAELKAYGIRHGYKDGWAANQYRVRFEAWPDWSIKHVPPAVTISATTALWIKSRAIAWAKRRKPEEAHA